jgi:hypothetical protein
VGLLVQLEVVEGEHVTRVVRHHARASQDGPDACDHLLEAERLRDVVVAADRQPRDLVLDVVACGEEQHGDVASALPELAGHLEAVHVRHHHVEHDQVGTVLLGLGERRRAVRRGHHVVPGEPQRRAEQVADRRLVVDDQQAGCCARGAHADTMPPHPGKFLDAPAPASHLPRLRGGCTRLGRAGCEGARDRRVDAGSGRAGARGRDVGAGSGGPGARGPEIVRVVTRRPSRRRAP